MWYLPSTVIGRVMPFPLVLLTGCSDYSLGSWWPFGDKGATDAPTTEADPESPPRTCEVDLLAEGADVGAPACGDVSPAEDPWDIERWFEGTPTLGCRVTAVAAFDPGPWSQIVCAGSHYGTPTVAAIDAPSATANWSAAIDLDYPPTAVADVDGNGDLETATLEREWAGQGSALLLDAEGAEIWRSETVTFALDSVGVSVAIADLEGDGAVEVVTHRAILDGATGTTRAWLNTDNEFIDTVRDLAIGDVDRDGDQEIASAWELRDSDGSLLWSIEPATGDNAVGVALFQADVDEEAEIAWLSELNVVYTEADGTVLLERELPDAEGGFPMPCALDADGDGLMEIVFSTRTRLHVWTASGEELWSLPIEDDSTYTTCSSFDFDADGRREILYNDEHTFYILDAATGAVRFSDAWESGTRADLPVVADLDHDGSVEIVLGHPWPYEGYIPLRVYRHATAAWPPGSPYWGSEIWSGTGVWPDGEVQRTPDAPWLQGAVWRGQPTAMVWGRDLRPEVVDGCVSGCDDEGDVHIAVRLANLGPQTAPAGTPVAVYTLDGDGARTLATVLETDRALAAGDATSPAWELSFSTGQALHGVTIVAGDVGTGTLAAYDCDATNSTVTWAPEECH